MRMLPQPSQDSGQRCVVLEHGSESLEFNIVAFARSENFPLIVKEINQYWAELPPKVQDAIWQCYVEAHDAIESFGDSNALLRELRSIVAKLYTYHDVDPIMTFVRLKSLIKIPTDLKTQYGPDAPDSPLTYLRSEYVELLGLTLQLRVIFPIWGAYMARIKDDVGATFKELAAVRILNSSSIVESRAYIRLQAYFAKYMSVNPAAPMGALINGLGTEELPDWLLALVLVRRISVAELPDATMHDDAKSLIANIYNYTNQKAENVAKSFPGVVKDKNPNADDRAGSTRPGDENNTSNPEGYKIKEDQSGATITAYSVYMENHGNIIPLYEILANVDPTVPTSLLDTFLVQNRNNRQFDIDDGQLALVQYCLFRQITARGIPSLAGDALLNAVSVTQAVLWHWGLKDLAAIAGGLVIELPPTTYSISQRNKLTKTQIDQLVVMFPHYQLVKGKKESRIKPDLLNPEERIKQNITHNPGIAAIEILAEDLGSVAWKVFLSKSFMAQTTLIRGEFGLQYGPKIRQDLADLVIRTNTITKTTE